jgi:hypothetical protein
VACARSARLAGGGIVAHRADRPGDPSFGAPAGQASRSHPASPTVSSRAVTVIWTTAIPFASLRPCGVSGLLDREIERVIEFYPSLEAAEAELAVILSDEPTWVAKLGIVLVDFSGAEPAVTAA